MPEALEKLKQQFLEFWGNLDKSQKSRILITSGILFLTVTIAILVLAKPQYVELMSVNDPAEYSEIKAKLTEAGIDIKAGNNNTILVKESQVNDASLLTYLDPTMAYSVDFKDTWENVGLGHTESDKKRLFENFKNEKIVNMIKSMDNIKDVKVEAYIADTTAYFEFDDEAESTAVVKITPRMPISNEQAEGIKRLVAHAIGGMKLSNVILLDNSGNIIGGDSGDDFVSKTNSQYDLRASIKKNLENDVLSLYSGMSSDFDYIKVIVNPVLDFNREVVKYTEYKNSQGIDDPVISSREIKEVAEGGGTSGEPGINSNGQSPSYPAGTTSSGSKYNRTEKERNLVYDKIDGEREIASGVLIPEKSTVTVAIWYGNRVQDDANITDELIQSIRNDAAGATGIPVNKITVNKYKRAPQIVEETTLMENLKVLFDSYGFYIPLLILIIVLVFALKPRSMNDDEFILTSNTGINIKQVEEEEEEEVHIKNINMDKRDVLKEQLTGYINKKPDSVAQLLRNWLQDDWD